MKTGTHLGWLVAFSVFFTFATLSAAEPPQYTSVQRLPDQITLADALQRLDGDGPREPRGAGGHGSLFRQEHRQRLRGQSTWGPG